MALGAKYPAVLIDANDQSRNGEFIQFTDSSDQPSGDQVPFQPTLSGEVVIVEGNDGDDAYSFTDSSPGPGTHNFTGIVAVDGDISGDAVNATELQALDAALFGLTGAVSPVRYVGGTAAVAPTTGTFAVGDVVVSLNGSAWVCTVAGSPGTWVALMANQLTSAGIITSGTLPNTGAWVSGTAKVNPVARDITVNVECVFDGTANAATVVIGVSPDNSTFTTVGTPGVSAAINTVGGLTQVVPVSLPKGWAIKLTIAAHASVAASIYY